MGNDRDGFVFYKSFLEAIKNLENADRLAAYEAILKYGIYGTDPDDNCTPIARAIFMMARPQLDANNKRYENGKNGGRPKPNNNQEETKHEPNNNQTITKLEPNDNQTITKQEPKDKEKDKDKDKDLKEKQSKKKAAASAYSDDPALDRSIKNFIESRRKMRKPMTDNAIDLFCRHLEKLAPENHEEQITLINTAIERGWQTVYPPGDSKKREPGFKQNTYTADELSALDN